MIEIKNSVFDFQAQEIKDKVYGITLSGGEDVVIKGCKFSNKGYSAILNNSTGNVIVEDCEFDCVGMYNPIEGGQSKENGNVMVSGCTFKGVPGNNYINFYNFADKSNHVIENCTFEPSEGTNILRISNLANSSAQFTVRDCEYKYPEGYVATDYTKFLLCQDYTSKNGKKQDFTKCSVTFKNVKCDGEVLSEDSDKLVYVWEDGKGLITGTDNDPVIKFE